MKKKKKIFILSDGRIFFNSVIPFYRKSLILISYKDSFFRLNWIFTNNPLKRNKIDNGNH